MAIRVFVLLLVASAGCAQERMLWEHDPDVAPGKKPIRVTKCELSENPEDYAGRIVELRAHVYIGDVERGFPLMLRSPIGLSNNEKCRAPELSIIAVLPETVQPRPSFSLARDENFKQFRTALEVGYEVHVTFRGRLDLAPVRGPRTAGRRSGFGSEHSYDARLVIQSAVDVYAFPRITL